jgi:hypothetical protein
VAVWWDPLFFFFFIESLNFAVIAVTFCQSDGVALGARQVGVVVNGTGMAVAVGENVVKCPCPLSVLKETYDHGCY